MNLLFMEKREILFYFNPLRSERIESFRIPKEKTNVKLILLTLKCKIAERLVSKPKMKKKKRSPRITI